MTEVQDPFREVSKKTPFALSATARTRRETMLPLVLGALGRRRRARTVARWGGLLAVVSLPAVFLLFFQKGGEPDMQAGPEIAAPVRPIEPPFQMTHAQFESVRTDPDIVKRCQVLTPPAGPECLVDDAGFLAFLSESPKPMGLVRAGNRVLLLEN